MTSRRAPIDASRRNARSAEPRRNVSRRGSARGSSDGTEGTEDDNRRAGAGVDWDEPAEHAPEVDVLEGPPAAQRPGHRVPTDRRRSGAGGSGWRATLRLIGAGLLIGGVTVLAAYGAFKYAKTSPRFSVRQIEVEGLRRVGREALLEKSGVRVGQNVFSVDTDSIGKKVLADRWLSEVRVERRLPATVRITVVERDAGALAMVGENLLVVTRSGEPFKRFETGDPTDLPVITGVSLDEPGREPAVEKRRIGTALEVLRHYERFAIARTYPAQEVHLTPGGEVVLIIGKAAISLHLGVGPWAKKLAMAERILQKMHGRKEAPSMVFLDNRAHPERVVVRMK